MRKRRFRIIGSAMKTFGDIPHGRHTGLALALGFLLPNVCDQRHATLDFPSEPILSRVRCIALFGVLLVFYPPLTLTQPLRHDELLSSASIRLLNQFQRLDERNVNVFFLQQGRESLGGDFLEVRK